MKSELPEPPEHPKSIVFLGTPEAAVPSLRKLVEAGFEIPLVITMPDRRRSRRSAPTGTAVKQAASELGLRVSKNAAEALEVGADCGVVVAFGQLISEEILSKLPMINVHFSLLPKWRGAAPVERAILAGDETTGVCIMRLDVDLDTGPIYSSHEAAIGDDVTAPELTKELAEIGANELVSSLRRGLVDPSPQLGTPSLAKKITRSDLKLDWRLPAVQLNRFIRVGGAWTTNDSSVLKVHSARVVPGEGSPGALENDLVATGSDLLQLLVVQPEGKNRLAARDWINGARLGSHPRLGL